MGILDDLDAIDAILRLPKPEWPNRGDVFVVGNRTITVISVHGGFVRYFLSVGDLHLNSHMTCYSLDECNRLISEKGN